MTYKTFVAAALVINAVFSTLCKTRTKGPFSAIALQLELCVSIHVASLCSI